MSGTQRSVRFIVAVAAAAVVAAFPGAGAMAHSHAVGDSGARAARATRSQAKQDTLRGTHVFGWGFNSPGGVASDGTYVWVVDNDSLTELNAATGALVKVITGSRYGFISPWAVSSDGTHVWVANKGNPQTGQDVSVTELNAATGALVQVISGPSYGFNDPDAVSSDGTHVWVANAG